MGRKNRGTGKSEDGKDVRISNDNEKKVFKMAFFGCFGVGTNFPLEIVVVKLDNYNVDFYFFETSPQKQVIRRVLSSHKY